MRPRPLDFVALLISILAVVGVSLFAYGTDRTASQISIQTESGTFLYPLDQDRMLTVTGPVGNTVIHLLDGAVHVAESDCRDKVCVAAGWLQDAGQWTACMPNRVFVRVEGATAEDEVDGQTY